jgi:hypothetical protein
VISRTLACAGLLAVCGVPAGAADASRPESGRHEQVERFVAEKLFAWQHRLQLDRWTITPVLTRRDALKPKTLGGIRWDKKKMSAVISLLDPADYRLPFEEMLDDLEFTIVHELVHLELAALPRSEASRGSEEIAVNQLTEALLSLERQR